MNFIISRVSHAVRCDETSSDIPVGPTAPGRGSVRCSRGCGHVIVIIIIGRLPFSSKAGMNGDLKFYNRQELHGRVKQHIDHDMHTLG
jgi:hypothetical protein